MTTKANHGTQIWALPIATPDGEFVAHYSSQGLCGLDFPSPGARPKPGTPTVPLPAGIRRWHATATKALSRALQGLEPEVLPPLDWSSGTEFQQRVWQVLRKIRPGHTRSYAEVARKPGIRRLSARSAGRAARTASPCSCLAIASSLPIIGWEAFPAAWIGSARSWRAKGFGCPDKARGQASRGPARRRAKRPGPARSPGGAAGDKPLFTHDQQHRAPRQSGQTAPSVGYQAPQPNLSSSWPVTGSATAAPKYWKESMTPDANPAMRRPPMSIGAAAPTIEWVALTLNETRIRNRQARNTPALLGPINPDHMTTEARATTRVRKRKAA